MARIQTREQFSAWLTMAQEAEFLAREAVYTSAITRFDCEGPRVRPQFKIAMHPLAAAGYGVLGAIHWITKRRAAVAEAEGGCE